LIFNYSYVKINIQSESGWVFPPRSLNGEGQKPLVNNGLAAHENEKLLNLTPKFY